jgi:hypothetical protein
MLALMIFMNTLTIVFASWNAAATASSGLSGARADRLTVTLLSYRLNTGEFFSTWVVDILDSERHCILRVYHCVCHGNPCGFV